MNNARIETRTSVLDTTEGQYEKVIAHRIAKFPDAGYPGESVSFNLGLLIGVKRKHSTRLIG